jgi:hypothetical protein
VTTAGQALPYGAGRNPTDRVHRHREIHALAIRVGVRYRADRKTSEFIEGTLIGGTGDRSIESRPRELLMLGIYFFLKFMIFFSIVKALVKFETLGNHFLFLGILYTSIVAFISYVFILSTQPGAFHSDWVMKINQATSVSPWLIWLAATLVLSTLYFKLLSKFDEGILFWILLIVGIPIALF